MKFKIKSVQFIKQNQSTNGNKNILPVFTHTFVLSLFAAGQGEGCVSQVLSEGADGSWQRETSKRRCWDESREKAETGRCPRKGHWGETKGEQRGEHSTGLYFKPLFRCCKFMTPAITLHVLHLNADLLTRCKWSHLIRQLQTGSHHLKLMFQASPFYGLVLLLPQLSVYGAPAWVIHHTLRSIKETLWLWELTVSLHRKTVLLSCPQCKDQYEKVLEDVSGYTPRYMEEMESIFEQSQEEERKRISFLKQAFLSIHRHLDVTNNERWAAFSVCSNFPCWGFNINPIIIHSAWKLCTMSSTKPWCPSMSKRISNGGRTIKARACRLTGHRLRCV